MTQSSTSSVFLSLSQHSQGRLAERVEDLSIPDFIDFLERTTRDFKQFLKVIDLINNQSLEPMLDELLETFTLKIGQILQAERTTIFVVDEDRQELYSKIAQGEGADSLEIRIPMGQGIAGYVAATGKGVNIPDAYADTRFSDATDKQTGYRTRNILCMPVMSSGGKVVAIAQLLNKVGIAPFSEADERRFSRFAPSIGILLETCQSFYLAARNQKGVAALLKAISSMEQSLNLAVTLQSVMAAARELMQADRSTLWLLDEGRGELWSQVTSADGQTLIDLRLPADKGIVGFVAASAETLNIPDAYRDDRFDASSDRKTGYKTRNILCMPVFNSSGKLMGVSQLINKRQGQFTTLDESFMKAFNTQAGIALENAQLFQEISQEKQYQKDMLESLSDAVISTDMVGRIVTINEAALKLLGCPVGEMGTSTTLSRRKWGNGGLNEDEEQRVNAVLAAEWQAELIGRYLWDVVPLERLQQRLEDSLQSGARHYVPEQGLTVSVATVANVTSAPLSHQEGGEVAGEESQDVTGNIAVTEKEAWQRPERCVLVVPDVEEYRLWGSDECEIVASQVMGWNRSINLTVSPLSDPKGGVRGGLVVLEDISQEKRMKTTLYRYMTPSVADRVMALGEDVLMVGERKDVTVLFSDIRGYTTLTEELEAAAVVSMLNEYFETMVEAVFHCEGTLDKFIGDALMAVFGAPLPLENHAWSAVRSAMDMRQRLVVFNEERLRQGQPELRIGIGLSSGEVVSGNIGSQRKMEYTVIGDGVNLSSRLESITKQYGCDIVLSEHTYERCKERIRVRELDLIRVKGKMEPVKIYELLGETSEPIEMKEQIFLDLYAQGREAYKAASFDLAISLFNLAQALRPSDRAVELHLSRSQMYLLRPPAEDWDGVHVMTMK